MYKKMLILTALMISSMTSLMAYEYASYESYDDRGCSYEAVEVCDDYGCISVEAYSEE